MSVFLKSILRLKGIELAFKAPFYNEVTLALNCSVEDLIEEAKKENTCCESCCCPCYDNTTIAKFLRHVADFFSKKNYGFLSSVSK